MLRQTVYMKEIENVAEIMRSDCDPDGCYTGVGNDPYAVPVQDADDL